MTLSAVLERWTPFRGQAAFGERVATGWQRLADGHSVPGALRARLAFERGERVLAVARDPAGHRALIATDRALCYRAGDADWQRLGWERVTGVNWASADRSVTGGNGTRVNGTGAATTAGRLVVTTLRDDRLAGNALAGGARRRAVVPLGARGSLPELAAERLTHTMVGRWPVALPGGREVLIEVRRQAVAGEFLWVIRVAGSGRGPDDHSVRAQVEAEISRLRAAAGIQRADGTLPGLLTLCSDAGVSHAETDIPLDYVPRPRAPLPRAGVGRPESDDRRPRPVPLVLRSSPWGYAPAARAMTSCATART